MAETYHFRLPLLAAAQAQKHVTVNEALARIDALALLRVEAVLAVAPGSAVDGECFLVASGSNGVWAGRDREVAIRSNGGWSFAVPQAGWAAWNVAAGARLVFDGVDWVAGALAVSGGGAATLAYVKEFDHVVGAGATSVTAVAIPGHAQVLGVSARVLTAISGAGIGSFSIGVAADAGRYGSGIGLAAGSYAKGITGVPVTYYVNTGLILTPNAGSFAAGLIRIAVHLTEIVPPRAG